MNIVILVGRLSSEPRRTELPSGTERWNLELSCPLPDGRLVGVPVTCERGVADAWCTGTELVGAAAWGEVPAPRPRPGALRRVARSPAPAAIAELRDAA